MELARHPLYAAALIALSCLSLVAQASICLPYKQGFYDDAVQTLVSKSDLVVQIDAPEMALLHKYQVKRVWKGSANASIYIDKRGRVDNRGQIRFLRRIAADGSYTNVVDMQCPGEARLTSLLTRLYGKPRPPGSSLEPVQMSSFTSASFLFVLFFALTALGYASHKLALAPVLPVAVRFNLPRLSTVWRRTWQVGFWLLLLGLTGIIVITIDGHLERKQAIKSHEQVWVEPKGQFIKFYESQQFALTVWQDNRYEFIPLSHGYASRQIKQGQFTRPVFQELREMLNAEGYAELSACLMRGHVHAPDWHVALRGKAGSKHVTTRNCDGPVDDPDALQALTNIRQQLYASGIVPEPAPLYWICQVRGYSKPLYVWNGWYEKLRYGLRTGDVFFKRCGA